MANLMQRSSFDCVGVFPIDSRIEKNIASPCTYRSRVFRYGFCKRIRRIVKAGNTNVPEAFVPTRWSVDARRSTVVSDVANIDIRMNTPLLKRSGYGLLPLSGESNLIEIASQSADFASNMSAVGRDAKGQAAKANERYLIPRKQIPIFKPF
jgi:hypothetical protein